MFIFPVSTPNFVDNPPRRIISAPSGRNAQLVPVIGANFASKFGALIRTQFRSELHPRYVPQNLRSVPLEVVGWLPCILLYRFLRRRPSIEISASSFLRFSENSFCRKPSIRDLTPCVAVVLSVSLLATKTPVLRRSLCVGHDTAKPRQHWLATDASKKGCKWCRLLVFSVSFGQYFLDPENRLYR